MAELLSYIALGAICGAAITAGIAYRLWRQAQNTAIALESQLRAHSFELQIALDELAEKNNLLLQQSRIDSLSGVFNRSYFDQQMRSELKRSRREQRPLALILLDIDHFKQVNDTLGHLAGDQAITAVANLIKQQLKRPADKVSRYGGEEFALILPATNIEGATQLAEQIRVAVSSTALMFDQQSYQLTISAGCYAAIANADSDNNDFIACADAALYRAKHNGRNQVQCYIPDELAAADTATGASNEH